MAVKVPIITEFNKAGLTNAEQAMRQFGVQSTREMKKAAAGFGVLAVAGGKAFSELDAGYDAIIAGTGATGKALQALKSDAEAVARAVPNSFEDVGIAVAELNTRVGVTGPELQDMAKRFLDLSRVAGVDVRQAIALTTRTFKDWGVTTDEQSGTLDKLYAATQLSGVGFDSLNASVVQFGAPLRQMGFTLDETIALFAEFELQGVNTETVMSGMRQGLGRLSKAGEEPAEAFRRIVDQIENVGTTGEANALAIETFGQRAGPDMAAAIREGRFGLDQMVASLGDAEGALATAAEETLSANDRLAMLKNQILTAAAPAVETMAEVVDKLAAVLNLMPRQVQGGVVALGALAVASSSARSAFKAFGSQMTTGTRSATALNSAVGVAGVALVAYAAHSYAAQRAQDQLARAMDRLSRATDAQAVDAFGASLVAGAFAGDDMRETLDNIARVSPGTIDRLLDMEAASGDLTATFLANGASVDEVTELLDEMAGALDREKLAIEAAARVQERSNRIVDDASGAVADLTDELGDNEGATDDAAQAADEFTTEISELESAFADLRGEMSDRSAYLDVQDSFDDLKTKGQEAWDAAATGAEDAESAARDFERAQMDAKNEVIDYATEIGNVPAETVSDIIALIDEGKLAEAQEALDGLERARTASVTVNLSQGTGWGNAMGVIRAVDSGGPIASGETALVAERRPEFVNGALVTEPSLVTGPARVTGGAATADMLRRSSFGGGAAISSGSGSGGGRQVVVSFSGANFHGSNLPQSTIDQIVAAVQRAERLSR